MKILVKSNDEPTIRLWIPNFLISAKFLYRMIQKNTKEFSITEQQFKVVVRGLKESIRYFPKLEIINVETHDQERVKITL